MDTKEKSREAVRQRPADQRAPARSGGTATRENRAAAEQCPAQKRPQAAQKPAAQQRSATQQRSGAQQPAQQKPAAQRPAGKKPAAQPRQAQRPAQSGAQSAPPRQRPAQQTVPRQRRRQEDGIPRSAPQGTGPRKSAPQRSRQEAAQYKKQKLQPPKKPEKKTVLQNLKALTEKTPEKAATLEERKAARQKKREVQAQRRRRQETRDDTPAVIYTQPQSFNRDKLLLQLLVVVAVVAALVLGMSVFFKVETITVAGAETYSSWAVREASGISEGDSLLTFSRSRASAQIMAQLSYVNDVRIGIKLPDTVIIYIEELDVAYAILSENGDWWLINSDGRVVEQITGAEAANYTQVLGVALDSPQVGLNAVASEAAIQETTESGEPIPITVTGAQRLSSALQILKALEANDIVGEAASVDVTEQKDIRLWYGTRYEVILGDTSRMEEKIASMNGAILQMSEYQSGILDITFYTRSDIIYTPFG